jgi:hypothetical protein
LQNRGERKPNWKVELQKCVLYTNKDGKNIMYWENIEEKKLKSSMEDK